MPEICSICGLPKELCVCEAIAKEATRIKISLERKRFGKLYTIIEGIDPKEIDLKELLRKLKSALACGGTLKERKLELQGDHKARAKAILVEAGFDPAAIELE